MSHTRESYQAGKYDGVDSRQIIPHKYTDISFATVITK